MDGSLVARVESRIDDVPRCRLTDHVQLDPLPARFALHQLPVVLLGVALDRLYIDTHCTSSGFDPCSQPSRIRLQDPKGTVHLFTHVTSCLFCHVHLLYFGKKSMFYSGFTENDDISLFAICLAEIFTTMVETHGRTVRKLIRSISTFFFTNPYAVVVKQATLPGVSSSSPTILRKLHKNKLRTGAPSASASPPPPCPPTPPPSPSPSKSSSATPSSAHSTVSSPLLPAGMISRARSCNLRCPDPLVAGGRPLHRSYSDTAAASTRRPPRPTHFCSLSCNFQSCSHTPCDHLLGLCGCEAPVVPAMSSHDAWKVMGRRFEKASLKSRHELVPARRQLGGAFEISASRQAVACEAVEASVRRRGPACRVSPPRTSVSFL